MYLVKKTVQANKNFKNCKGFKNNFKVVHFFCVKLSTNSIFNKKFNIFLQNCSFFYIILTRLAKYQTLNTKTNKNMKTRIAITPFRFFSSISFWKVFNWLQKNLYKTQSMLIFLRYLKLYICHFSSGFNNLIEVKVFKYYTVNFFHKIHKTISTLLFSSILKSMMRLTKFTKIL